MMKKVDRAGTLAALLLFSLSGGICAAQSIQSTSQIKLVVVGDSLAAGVQNIALLDSQQVHNFASLIAGQVNVPLTLPLIGAPGLPPPVRIVSLGPPPVVAPAADPTGPPATRTNPGVRATNISVPGYRISDSLGLIPTPTPNPASPVSFWAWNVLAYPTPQCEYASVCTQAQWARALKPNAMIVWLGSNDALIPALSGGIPLLTSVADFEASYKSLLDELAKSQALMAVANIPDVTQVPYFIPAKDAAKEFGIPPGRIEEKLGISRDDYLRRGALPVVKSIASGSGGSLQGLCGNYVYAFPSVQPGQVPCVLKAADVELLKTRIDGYNQAISRQARAHNALLVDIHGLVDDISKKGYKVAKQKLTTEYLEGLFSLDGVHPSNTGHAIIANEFIDTINKATGLRIPAVSVEDVFARDPLRMYTSGK